ncbi:hypothetical protein AGMMS4957_19580 [Bacteroidia bacterium]|nr:hypothetical protein AGMMS4957_19580 [Bacteroidia bacterium]
MNIEYKNMRKAVIFCLLSIPGMLTAQHSLQSNLNMFRAEDLIIKQQVSYKDPGRAGMNVLWDFSELDVENDDYGLLYSDGINSIHAGLSSMILGVENVTESHYKLSGDSLLLLGFRKYPGTVMKHKTGGIVAEISGKLR